MRSRSTSVLLAITGVIAFGTPDLPAQNVVEEGTGVTTVDAEGNYDHALAARANAIRSSGSISIDGVLDELVWSRASPITDFVQTLPVEGSSVSERTDVRIAFDDDAVYVGAVLEDRSPVTT